MQDFDPGAAADPESGLFGLDPTPGEAGVHVLPVPFDATTSFRRGAARGPEAVLRASHQVDLFDALTGKPYEAGIWMAPVDERIVRWNEAAGERAERVIAAGGVQPGREDLAADAAFVNGIQEELNGWVREAVGEVLAAGKLPAVLGGDHSVPFGAIEACAAAHPGLGILHFDAHHDLREAYEGFTWSHASILHNVVTRLDGVAKVVQVGIRDFCEEEARAVEASKGRIRAVHGHTWARARLQGRDLIPVVREALKALPRDVFVTFDVDGLDPALCPNTGTPVPGGLTWSEAMLWLDELTASGRRVVGLDLNEVAPGTERPPGAGWDEIVGARLLYRLIGFALKTRG